MVIRRVVYYCYTNITLRYRPFLAPTQSCILKVAATKPQMTFSTYLSEIPRKQP